MKKIIIFVIAAVITTTIEAKKNEDPIIMSIAGKDVPLSEFIFMAKKDNSVDFANKQSVEAYVELFKNYKLKVTDAEALKVNESDRFKREFEDYKRQLQQSFLADKAGEDSAIHVIYERVKVIPAFTYIAFKLPDGDILPADTVAPYNHAMEAYRRYQNGEPFDSICAYYKRYGGDSIASGSIERMYPLQMMKTIEDKVYALDSGEVSSPFRSLGAFHIVRIDRKTLDPGRVRVAHILTFFGDNTGEPTEAEIEAAHHKTDSLYQLLLDGEDFAEVAKKYSDDTISAPRGGALNYFGIGEMVEPFEKAAFSLAVGEISKPVQTRYGFHIIKLLDYRKDVAFEEVAPVIAEKMKATERQFDLYHGFDQKMRAKHGYIFYPDAYADFEALANKYFPADTAFFNRAIKLDKTLLRLDTIDFVQLLFADFLYKNPTSAKTLSTDYMHEIYELFVRHIVTEMEREKLESDYPEYRNLVKEYYDGILLFEVSNKRVWSQPAEEQPKLEEEWIKELNEKYPVTINKKVLKQIKKYL